MNEKDMSNTFWSYIQYLRYIYSRMIDDVNLLENIIISKIHKKYAQLIV